MTRKQDSKKVRWKEELKQLLAEDRDLPNAFVATPWITRNGDGCGAGNCKFDFFQHN